MRAFSRISAQYCVLCCVLRAPEAISLPGHLQRDVLGYWELELR